MFDRVWVSMTVELKDGASDGVIDIADVELSDGAGVVDVGAKVSKIAEDVGVSDEYVGVMVR